MTAPPPGQWPPPPQGPPPQWGPPPPPVQPKVGNRAKWVLGGLALVVVVVLTVVTTLLFTRGGPGSSTPSASAPTTSLDTSDIASADDRGPAGIITEEPTCAAWGPINDKLGAEQRRGWDKRDPSIPGSAWSSEQRAEYAEIARAMRSAADRIVSLAIRTPHRVIRELYEQVIAYSRKYADAIPSYEPRDDHLALVAVSASATLVWLCAAIDYGSATARAPLIVQGTPPLQFAKPAGPEKSQPFMSTPSPVCSDWASMVSQFTADTDAWAAGTDPNVPAASWSPQQQSLFTSVVSAMQHNADEVDQLGIRSRNPILEDFASTAAQYRRAFVQAVPTYQPADNYLDSTASQLLAVVDQACKAAGA
ncbi:hypothetical protein Mycch_0078 [Mycolicibacterium chubuense NBB4]|uniref:Uncharacterized protein n=1 Tax=Mycolicibacterium chubuense (strain NBB4) TaxID=710421 RepID=I4BC98_MYCCN|nr:hypothetical protein Mycch_0078 [Mycolicibacterium chubuense NBB4]